MRQLAITLLVCACLAAMTTAANGNAVQQPAVSADPELAPRRVLPGGGKGKRLLLTGTKNTAAAAPEQQADSELAPRRVLPGGGKGKRLH